jgi:uncharacterized protein
MVIAVVIPAIYFGLAHTTNENATWLSTFNIVIFGLLFGTGYVLTGELALPIGLHFGWNFVQGFVFGVVAEEKEYGSVLVLTDDSSATLWIGQPYGAEGGLIGTAPSLPPSWQHSHGPDLTTAQPCWPPLSTPTADAP